MDIFPSISRSKGNQTMKFGKLTEKHKKHFSWKIMHRMRWRNYSQTLFWRKKIEHKSFIQFVFLHAKLRNIRKLSYRPLAVTLYLAFSFLKKQKTNKDLELVSLPHYLYNFWKKKYIYPLIFYSLTKFHCLITFTSWDIGQCLLQLFANQVVTSWILK